jgi:DUF971 family protein
MSAQAFDTAYWPLEIRIFTADKRLEIDWDDGVTFNYPAEYLRVESPSAEVQGHGPGQRVLIAGRRHVGILGIDPVGHYAIRIRFDDLHDTGLFTWPYLYDLGQRQAEKWDSYVSGLAEKGLSREPARRG